MDVLREAGEPKPKGRAEPRPFVPNVIFFLAECLERGIWPKPLQPTHRQTENHMTRSIKIVNSSNWLNEPCKVEMCRLGEEWRPVGELKSGEVGDAIGLTPGRDVFLRITPTDAKEAPAPCRGDHKHLSPRVIVKWGAEAKDKALEYQLEKAQEARRKVEAHRDSLMDTVKALEARLNK